MSGPLVAVFPFSAEVFRSISGGIDMFFVAQSSLVNFLVGELRLVFLLTVTVMRRPVPG